MEQYEAQWGVKQMEQYEAQWGSSRWNSMKHSGGQADGTVCITVGVRQMEQYEAQ